jgi:N-acetylneuraminate synthase
MSVKWIADIGSNHNGDIDRAVRLIEFAKSVGCSAAKFQMFDSSLHRDPAVQAVLNKRALPAAWLPRLRGAANCNEIELHMTITSVDSLMACKEYVHALKIGSYEILCINLIALAASTKLPLSISTGGATKHEINNAVMAAEKGGCHGDDLTIYHCSSYYPAKPENCNLHKIEALSDEYFAWIGWSDHTVKPGVIHAAIGAGAEVIEVHMDLDGLDGWESEHGHCWEVSKLRRLIKTVREGERAMLRIHGSMDAMRMQRTDPRDAVRPLK